MLTTSLEEDQTLLTPDWDIITPIEQDDIINHLN